MSWLITIRKILLWGCVGLISLAAVVWIGDEVWARMRGKPTEQVPVGHLYVDENRYNETEYSVGPPGIETCVDALLPHFGDKPCWYLKKHNIEQINTQ